MLQVENLRVGYGESIAVDGVNFRVQRGEALGLVGESGCGKSTIAKALLGLLPDNGWQTGEVQREGKIGWIFQDPMTRLNPLLTVADHGLETLKAHFPQISPRSAKQKFYEMLALVRLAPRCGQQYPHQLSGGQRQRVMIALTLLFEPQLLIADEPATSLDVEVAQEILAELTRLRLDRGLALILISHDLGLVGHYCDRLAVMSEGLIVEMGETIELLTRPRHPYSQYLVGAGIRWGDRHDSSPHSEVPLLVVQNLTKTYDLGWRKKITAVDRLSFSLHGGETLGLIGASGSGKSTTARLILQLLPADQGSIRFRGQELRNLAHSRLKKVRPYLQMIFQDPRACFHPYLSVLDSTADVLLFHQLVPDRAHAHQQALAILDRMGISPSLSRRFPKELSGGQLQRSAIARALILKPQVLICDEPVSMLDAPIQRQVLELLLELQKELRLSYLFITHDLAVAQFMADRLAVMYQGQIVEEGATGQVIEQPTHAYTRSLFNSYSHFR